jgi:hypothetical protein
MMVGSVIMAAVLQVLCPPFYDLSPSALALYVPVMSGPGGNHHGVLIESGAYRTKTTLERRAMFVGGLLGAAIVCSNVYLTPILGFSLFFATLVGLSTLLAKCTYVQRSCLNIGRCADK